MPNSVSLILSLVGGSVGRWFGGDSDNKDHISLICFFIFIASTNLLLNENIMALKPRLKMCQSLFSHILLSATVIC